MAVDDRGGGARLAPSRFSKLYVESFVDSPERAIPIPAIALSERSQRRGMGPEMRESGERARGGGDIGLTKLAGGIAARSP